MTEYHGGLTNKKKAELLSLAQDLGIDTSSLNRREALAAAIKQTLSDGEETFANDPRFKRLYTGALYRAGSKPASSARSRRSMGGTLHELYGGEDEEDEDHEEAIRSSASPENSSSGQSVGTDGIPRGRELPRSPIRSLTDSIPLTIPGSVKKLASNIFGNGKLLATPTSVAREAREMSLEVVPSSVTRASRRAKEAIFDVARTDVDDIVHEGQVAVSKAREGADDLLAKAQELWKQEVWVPSGKILSTPTSQTVLLLALESLVLLSSTFLWEQVTLEFPPAFARSAAASVASSAASVAGTTIAAATTAVAAATHTVYPHAGQAAPVVAHAGHAAHAASTFPPWVALTFQVPSLVQTFRGWDATERLYYPFVIWTVVGLFLPYVLALLIASPTAPTANSPAKRSSPNKTKTSAHDISTTFHILRLALFAALATTERGSDSGSAIGRIVGGAVRRTGLDGGLGLVLSGLGVLLGLQRGLGGEAATA